MPEQCQPSTGLLERLPDVLEGPRAALQEARRAEDLSCTLVGSGWFFRLRGDLLIGRHLDCDLQLDTAQVSARHAEIYSDGDLWWVRDLQSAGGTFLEGEPIEAAPIVVPCEIRLGPQGPALRLEGLVETLEGDVESAI